MEYIKCYLSEVGHKNFFYPTENTALIPKGGEYNILPWIGGQAKSLTPVKIKKSCVVPLNMCPPATIKGTTVVWIDNSLLPLSSVGRANDC